jgi:hypothetical protein
MEKKAIEVREEDLLKSKDIVVDEDSVKDNTIVVEEGSEPQPVIQVGAWTNANDFVKYCVNASRSAPEIRADNINSLRRAIAYYDNLGTEIVEGAAADADHAELNMNQLETLDKVEELVDVVKGQLEVAASRVGILKTASKSAGFVYVVDPFLFAIARLCINAKISNGKNIEETFRKVAEKFQINDRETFSLQQIMRDMGYPIAGSFVAENGFAPDMIRQYFA